MVDSGGSRRRCRSGRFTFAVCRGPRSPRKVGGFVCKQSAASRVADRARTGRWQRFDRVAENWKDAVAGQKGRLSLSEGYVTRARDCRPSERCGNDLLDPLFLSAASRIEPRGSEIGDRLATTARLHSTHSARPDWSTQASRQHRPCLR